MRSTHGQVVVEPPREGRIGLMQAGLQLMETRHYEEAIAVFDDAVRATPTDYMPWEALGACHVQIRRFAAAERCYREAMTLQQQPMLSTVCGLAEVLAYTERYDDALKTLRGIAHQPRDHDQEAWYQAGFGNVLALAFDLNGAEICYRESIRLNPGVWLVHTSLGHVYTEQRKWEKAEACYDRAYRLQKNMQTAHALGECRMREGRYEDGWRLWETRIGEPKLQHRDRRTPRWDGRYCDSLCIWHEGGVGDATMFSRYLPLVASRVGTVKIAVPHHLCEYLRGFKLPDNMEVVERIQPGSYDRQAAMMSLPLLTGLYAPADAPAPLRLRDTVPVAERLDRPLTVVLNWGGASIHPNDRVRSTDLEQWAALVRAFPNVVWWNLSPEDEAAEDIRRVQLPIVRRTGTLSQACQNLLRADLCISVDSGIAHVAATLGVPTWTLLTYSPEWRWPLDGDTTPLYPSMRLFRQQQPRQWQPVIAAVAAALKERLGVG